MVKGGEWHCFQTGLIMINVLDKTASRLETLQISFGKVVSEV